MQNCSHTGTTPSDHSLQFCSLRKAQPWQGRMSSEVQQLSIELRRFAEDRDWDQFHSVKNLILALTGEVGELAEVFQWLSEAQIDNLSREDRKRAAEEMADVFLYLLRLSDKLDVNLIEAAFKKLEVNAVKYPINEAKGNAVKYNRR